MNTYIVYLWESEAELESADVSNLRSFSVSAEDEIDARREANEIMEIYEQYDPFGIHSIKKAP